MGYLHLFNTKTILFSQDSQVAKGTAPPGLSTLDVDHTIYLGSKTFLLSQSDLIET